MSSFTSNEATAGKILDGTVRSVDEANHRVEVAINNVPLVLPAQVCSAYCHPYDGEEAGSTLPEVDTQVKVFFPSEGNGTPFILGSMMPPTATAGDAGGRRRRQKGDIMSRTRGGAFCNLRRGGVVEIGASPLAQTVYLPLGNMLRSIFMQREDLTPLGELRWTHAEIGPDGRTKATLSFSHRDAVEDVLPRLHVTVSSDLADLMPEGYTSARPSATFSTPGPSFVRLKLDGGAGLSFANVLSEFAFQVSLTGDMYLHSQGYLLADAQGDIRLESRTAIEFVTPAGFDRTDVVGTRTIEAHVLDVSAADAIMLRSRAVDVQGELSVGGGAEEMVRGRTLLGQLAALVAALRLQGIEVPDITAAVLATSGRVT